MPKTFLISIFTRFFHWLETLHLQNDARVLLQRRQAFMRMQMQQRNGAGRFER
jgi:hypothetical protein